MAKVYADGEVLGGRVQVLQFLHLAGQGLAYKAKERDSGETVFLKQLNADPKTTNGGIAVKRFRREQSIAIDSRHVARVLGTFEHEGAFFTITEFIDGQSLDEMLCAAKGPLPPEFIRDLMKQSSEGLRAAHDKGIVHRDIKAANIMIERGTGRVVIVDWGLCRFLDQRTIHDTRDPMGTIFYMSPEHIRNRDVDRQSDIYSLGVVGYLCATVRYPFDGADEAEIFWNIMNTPPVPPSSINPNIDADLNAIILRMLSKDKTTRYPDAYALIHDIENGFGTKTAGHTCKCGEPIASGVAYCIKCGTALHEARAPYEAVLVVLNGIREGTRIDVPPGGTEVGRYSIGPDDDFISRYHARLFFADGRFWVEDMGSLNGTAVNSLAIPRGGRHPLMPGDHMRFADTFCEFAV